jgi:hypothetical protein
MDAPTIDLERVEIANIQQFFLAPKAKDKEGKEKTIKVGSIVNVAYIFNIKNPNKEPIMMDQLTFTTAWEGFEVNTVTLYEDAWIPGGMTNQIRVIATNEAYPTMLSLLVGAGNVERLKELDTKAPAIVKKWWETIADFAFEIEVVNGTAEFKTPEGETVRAAFTGKFGGKKE